MAKTDAEKLERRNRELSILNSIAQALNREVNLKQALESTLAQVADLLDLRTGWVWLLRDDNAQPYLAAAQNLPPALASNPSKMERSCFCLDTFRAGDLSGAANVNVITCSRLRGLVGDTAGLRYHASIPLYAQGKKLGVMNVASTDWRELAPEELQFLYTVGDVLSMAIERARLFARSVHFSAVDERNRLARELHDTLAQGLTGIILQLETADALLDAEERAEHAHRAVAQALALARANLDEARRSVEDLRAAPLEGRTLAQALAALAAQAPGEDGPEVSFEAVGSDRPFPVRLEAGLFRIAQEGLANVRRHAHAAHAHIRLETTPELVTLIVEDDGIGFEPARIPKGRYGLLGVNERARLLGGAMEVSSARGAGTSLRVTVPFDRKG